MTDENPKLDAAIEQHIHDLRWSDDVPDETVTLVAGNIRTAIRRLVEDGYLVPVDEMGERVRDLVQTALAMREVLAEICGDVRLPETPAITRARSFLGHRE